MSPCGSSLEEQLSSIMEVLSKAAVSEISQLFSEGSASLRLQISQSLKENEALRSRMKGMRSELVSLRLQTRSNAAIVVDGGFKPLNNLRAVGGPPPHPPPPDCEPSSVKAPAEETPDIILIKDEEDMLGGTPAENHSTPCGVATESPRADAAVSSNMAAHDEELRILSVYGRGEGPLAADGHDTLFTASELEALSSLSPDPSLTHDSLLGSHSGPSRRVPAPGGRGGPGRGGQARRRQSLRSAAQSPKEAAPEAQDPGRGAVPLSTLSPLQNSLEFPQGGGAKGLVSRKKAVSRKKSPCGPCAVCGKPFVHMADLNIHMRIHTGEKPFVCAQCGKRFTQSSILRNHMRTHSGERPCVCVQCGKCFTQSGTLRNHMRTHSGERPFLCPHCHARFRDPSHLRRHMMKHCRKREALTHSAGKL